MDKMKMSEGEAEEEDSKGILVAARIPRTETAYKVRIFVEVMYESRPVPNAEVRVQFYINNQEYFMTVQKTDVDGLAKVVFHMPDERPGKAVIFAQAYQGLYISDKVTVSFNPKENLVFKHLEF